MDAILLRFLQSEDGATAIEYGLIAAGIAIAISAAVYNLGSVVLTTKFNVIQNAVTP